MVEPESTNSVHADGPGWLPAVDDPGEIPAWTGGRCFPAVWRELLRFLAGGTAALADPRWRHLRLSEGWDLTPEPDSNADVDQAVAAKIHIGLRLLPVLATAQHVTVDPAVVSALPEWADDESQLRYGLTMSLPASPLFIDFEAADGTPASWIAPTWPLPLHLRGAACWAADDVVSIVPIGSVGGRNPFGGSDYEPWARIVFAPGGGPFTDPGPGDLIFRGDDMMAAWVNLEGGSLCAHRLALTMNLASRVMRLLWLLENSGLEMTTPVPPRAERRRAARAGKRISAVFDGLPDLHPADEQEDVDDGTFDVPCPIPDTHGRLEQAHVLWHEALDEYTDEVAFLRKLNPLIESLRTTTMVLQKEIKPLGDEIAVWYAGWQKRMGQDPKMQWVKHRRNEIVHEGSIEKHSRARVAIVGPGIEGRPVDMDVDPAMSALDLVRLVTTGGLNRDVRENGMLEVERRWSVEPFQDEELLDILAHCFGVLVQLVAEAHERLGGDMAACELNDHAIHNLDLDLTRRTGRPPCMWAGRESRTSRRDLESGAPITVTEVRPTGPPPTHDELLGRYGPAVRMPGPGSSARAVAQALHEQARVIMARDAKHDSIAWIVRDGAVVAQRGVDAASRRERHLIHERLGDDAARLAADAVVITSEAWAAHVLPEDDPRARLSASEREDREEELITHLVHKDGPVIDFASKVIREGDVVKLGPVVTSEPLALPVLASLRERWRQASA